MGRASKQRDRRQAAKQTLDELFRQPSIVNVIHYSCETFYDRPQGESPRIASVAVRNMGSKLTTSFSIHQYAEINKVAFDAITDSYDRLEREMLGAFYTFVNQNPNVKWLHWNMRNTQYGFPALAHRFTVLGGHPQTIPESQLFNLSSILGDIYGPAYIDHPRLDRLTTLNNISKLNFLSGSNEALAFERRNFTKLHLSTLNKVDAIHHLAERAWDETLQTHSHWMSQYGISLGGSVEDVTGHWLFQLLVVVSVIATIFGLNVLSISSLVQSLLRSFVLPG